MMEAIRVAHGYVREICDMQQELQSRVGTVKQEFRRAGPATDCQSRS